MTDLAHLSWPLERLGEAIQTLARKSGLESRALEIRLTWDQDSSPSDEELEWLVQTGLEGREYEAEPVQVAYHDVERFLTASPPVILPLRSESARRFLVVRRARRRGLELITPDHGREMVPQSVIRTALVGSVEADVEVEIRELLTASEVPRRRRDEVLRVLTAERLGDRPVVFGWMIRRAPGADFMLQVKEAGIPGLVSTIIGAHAGQELLLIFSWWMLGRGVLQGELEPGWMAAWALLLLTMTPLGGLERWSLAKVTARFGTLLKQRLLAGVLRLEPDEVRHQGIGQSLGRVVDSEAVETLAMSGAHLGLVGLVHVLLALPILALGAGGVVHALLLAAWCFMGGYLWWRYLGNRRTWTRLRLRITHELIEKMVGHRTRLVQESSRDTHASEDRDLARYFELSRYMDRELATLQAVLPQGWLLLGMSGLAVPFVLGTTTPGRLAVGVGGVLLGFKGLRRLVRSLAELAEALIAWENVAPLFHAAARPRRVVSTSLAPPSGGAGREPGESLLVAHDLGFNYRERVRPVFEGIDLEIRDRDRVLLEGPSGSGKSTLVSLLVGLRESRSGLLLMRGLDQTTLGEESWRRRAVAAPQFHENHVLTETLAFNLLMGRGWPPRAEDLADATEICIELGLGDLLERMPSGLFQMVGESGWKLSHGERSRLYIARALLQRADLVVLDESFAALDPENLRQAMECVLRRAPALIVIAHP